MITQGPRERLLVLGLASLLLFLLLMLIPVWSYPNVHQQTDPQDCMHCHDDPSEPDWKIPHLPLPQYKCTDCHAPVGVGPHGSGSCVGCHETMGEERADLNPHPEWGSCSECHGLPHSKDPTISLPAAPRAPEVYAFPWFVWIGLIITVAGGLLVLLAIFFIRRTPWLREALRPRS